MALLLFLQAACFFLSLSLGAPYHATAVAASPFSFSFDFSKQTTYNSGDLIVEGSAKIGTPPDISCNNMLDMNHKCTGRMSYHHPVPFYNITTGEVASFATQFTFAIIIDKGKSNSDRGDGIAFFLSNYPSMLPNDSSGANLGLHNGERANVSAGEGFIAVEFDTYNDNIWDPSGIDHIGIDINTVRPSVNTTSLPTLSLNGSLTALITFNSSTRVLEATLHFDDIPYLGPVQVSTQLRDPVTSLLSAEVVVGFSAATGYSIEVHQIMS